MNDNDKTILPFAVRGRWIVTIESECYFVKVRHRMRWYAVSRRVGHDDFRYQCVNHADAIYAARMLREHYEKIEWFEQIRAYLDRMTPIQQAKFFAYAATIMGKGDVQLGPPRLTLV